MDTMPTGHFGILESRLSEPDIGARNVSVAAEDEPGVAALGAGGNGFQAGFADAFFRNFFEKVS